MVHISIFELDRVNHSGWGCNDRNNITHSHALPSNSADVALSDIEASVLDQIVSHMVQIGEFDRAFRLANLFNYFSAGLRAVHTAIETFMV